MRKLLFLLVLAVLLVGCGKTEAEKRTERIAESAEELESMNEIDSGFVEESIEIANMIKSVYESGNEISDYELEKYSEYLDITEIDGRELTLNEIGIQSDVMKLSDFLTGDYAGSLTFEDEYENLINKLD